MGGKGKIERESERLYERKKKYIKFSVFFESSAVIQKHSLSEVFFSPSAGRDAIIV